MLAVTASQMRDVEAKSVQGGLSLDTLMDRAGTAVARASVRLARSGRVLVLVGPGNNGGDGLIAANRLLADGREVTVCAFHRNDLLGFSGPTVVAEEDSDLGELRRVLDRSAVVVDALLGIGQNRAPEGLLARILQACNEASRSATNFMAVDIPTGINADTGAVLNVAFRADETLCMGFIKRGAVLFPGAGFAGEVEVVDVGIPSDLTPASDVTVPNDTDVAQILPERHDNSNKGTYGRVLIVSGSRDFLGAPALVSVAALRSGAGLAEVASLAVVIENVAAHALEPIYLTLPERDGQVSTEAGARIDAALTKVTSLVYGPGLGVSDGTIELERRLLHSLAASHVVPAVIDADGLNALARIERWWETRARLILTPHPGEMSRLTKISVADIQSNRLDVARDHAVKWGQTVVLKGAGTIVADASGRASINTTGSANLSTGGTGDVLSGIIGGLLAQGCNAWDAAVAGTYLHGVAGDLIARELGLSGTLAGDLLGQIPRARTAILREAGVGKR